MSQPGPEQPGPPTQLDYAKRPPLAWISRHRKLLIFLAICIAIGTPIYRNWQPLKHRVLWLYWSHRAAAFVMPGPLELIVIDPIMVASISANSSDYVIGRASGSQRQAAACYVPQVYRRLLELDGRLNFGVWGSATSGGREPVIFMGTMRRSDGTPRLVVLTGAGGRTVDLLETLGTVVLPLPGWFDPLPPVTVTPTHGGVSYGPRIQTSLRSAVADPANPSHIIIPFVIGPTVDAPQLDRDIYSGLDVLSPEYDFRKDQIQGTGEIDAYLQNDDSLRFSLRGSFPLKSPITLNLGTAQMSGDVRTLEAERQNANKWMAESTMRPRGG